MSRSLPHVLPPWYARIIPSKPIMLWGLVGILALWLGYPNDLVHIPFAVLLFPVALVAMAAKAQRAGEAFRLGWLISLLGSATALYWLTIPVMQVGGLPIFLAIPCTLAIAAYVGLYGGVFALASFRLGKVLPHRPLQRILALACLWYGLELLRSVAFTGFPWLSLSSAFAPLPILVQGASVVGAFGLSAIFTGIALFLAESFLPSYAPYSTKTRTFMGGGAAFAFMLILAFGAYTLHSSPMLPLSEQTTERGAKPFWVIMVEGNVDQNIKWEPSNQRSTVKLYEDLSLKALNDLQQKENNAKPLVIWPETAMPFYLDAHPELGRRVVDFVRKIQSPLLVGAPAVNVDKKGISRPFNRAFLLAANGTLAGYYDKVHLVPFGEYVPSWLAWNFLDALLQGIGTFTPGKQAKPIAHGELALGVLICYEGIFPDLAQERVREGANVLINISNDGWFGDSSAPKQHLDMAIMRAIEQGRYVVRSTNTGISAIVDNLGRLRLEGEQFKAQALTGMALPLEEKSIFHRFYGFIPFIFLVIFVFCLWHLPIIQTVLARKKN